MNDALELFYYILSKALSTLFNIYFFNGVSLGMIFVCSIIFTILLRYALAVPKLYVGGRSRVSSNKKEAETKND